MECAPAYFFFLSGHYILCNFTSVNNDLPFLPEIKYQRFSRILRTTRKVFSPSTSGSIDSVMSWAVVGGCLQAKMEDRKETSSSILEPFSLEERRALFTEKFRSITQLRWVGVFPVQRKYGNDLHDFRVPDCITSSVELSPYVFSHSLFKQGCSQPENVMGMPLLTSSSKDPQDS